MNLTELKAFTIQVEDAAKGIDPDKVQITMGIKKIKSLKATLPPKEINYQEPTAPSND